MKGKVGGGEKKKGKERERKILFILETDASAITVN